MIASSHSDLEQRVYARAGGLGTQRIGVHAISLLTPIAVELQT